MNGGTVKSGGKTGDVDDLDGSLLLLRLCDARGKCGERAKAGQRQKDASQDHKQAD